MRYILAEMPDIPTITRLTELLAHLESWDIPLVSVTPSVLEIVGEIQDAELEHLGLVKEGG